MIRRPPRSTLDRSSAASDVYKRQVEVVTGVFEVGALVKGNEGVGGHKGGGFKGTEEVGAFPEIIAAGNPLG